MNSIVRLGLGLVLLTLVSGLRADWVSIGPDGGYVQALALDPQQPQLMLAVPSEYPDYPRIYKSLDGGSSWAEFSRFPDYYVTTFVVDPHQSNIIYAAGRMEGIYRSTDSGMTWTFVALPGQGIGLAADPLEPGRLYIAGYYITTTYFPAVYISTDYGLTWRVSFPDTSATGRYATSCVADPVENGTVYVGCTDSLVYCSTDGGSTWELRHSGLPAQVTVEDLAIDHDDHQIILAATGAGLFRSTNAGRTWLRTGPMERTLSVVTPLRVGRFAYSIGYDSLARLYISSDAGATWEVPSPGFDLTKGYTILAHPDSGTVAYLYGTTGVFRTSDQGRHWTESHHLMRFSNISTIALSPDDQNRLYLEMFENGIFRSTDAGESWTRCSDFLSCGNICAIAVARGWDSDILYALEGKG